MVICPLLVGPFMMNSDAASGVSLEDSIVLSIAQPVSMKRPAECIKLGAAHEVSLSEGEILVWLPASGCSEGNWGRRSRSKGSRACRSKEGCLIAWTTHPSQRLLSPIWTVASQMTMPTRNRETPTRTGQDHPPQLTLENQWQRNWKAPGTNQSTHPTDCAWLATGAAQGVASSWPYWRSTVRSRKLFPRLTKCLATYRTRLAHTLRVRHIGTDYDCYCCFRPRKCLHSHCATI